MTKIKKPTQLKTISRDKGLNVFLKHIETQINKVIPKDKLPKGMKKIKLL